MAVAKDAPVDGANIALLLDPGASGPDMDPLVTQPLELLTGHPGSLADRHAGPQAGDERAIAGDDDMWTVVAIGECDGHPIAAVGQPQVGQYVFHSLGIAIQRQGQIGLRWRDPLQPAQEMRVVCHPCSSTFAL